MYAAPPNLKRKRYSYDVARAYQAKKRARTAGYTPARRGYGSVARTRGAQVRGEMKYFDTERAATAIAAVTTTWGAGTILDPAVFNTLVVPTVGAAINQRIGREIKVYKIKIKGEIIVPTQAAQAAADNASVMRYLLVQDQQTNAAQMTSAQLLSDQAAADTTIHAFQNLNNFGRFKVLKDKYVVFGNLNVAGSPTAADLVQSGTKKTFKCSVKFRKPVSIRFNATNGGTVADIIDNSFHFIIAAENVVYVPTVSYVSRVCYKE